MRYYTILTDEQLNTPIPDMIKNYMEYDRNYLLKEVIFGHPKELKEDGWLCECLLRSKDYIENNCCNRLLIPEEVDMWRQFVGNIFTDISGFEFTKGITFRFPATGSV